MLHPWFLQSVLMSWLDPGFESILPFSELFPWAGRLYEIPQTCQELQRILPTFLPKQDQLGTQIQRSGLRVGIIFRRVDDQNAWTVPPKRKHTQAL